MALGDGDGARQGGVTLESDRDGLLDVDGGHLEHVVLTAQGKGDLRMLKGRSDLKAFSSRMRMPSP